MPAPDAFSLAKGAVFHDQYEVVRRIDSGAMGTVYEVVDRVTKRRRALKVMLARFVDNSDVTERFRREATITADVVSEHVVETFDAGVDASTGLPFLVMELLRGEDLGKVVARGPLPAADVIALLMQASSALDRMHAHGIVHRDLKPENLFITRRDDGSPRLKVLDFGIAKVVEKAAPSATSTRNMGTPVYMSPEQVLGAGNVGPAADLYAVGHLAYTMLTGQPYWLEDALAFETVYPLLLKIMQGASEPASERAKRNKQVTLPPAFDPWFAKATAHSPDDRYKSATASIFALADALDVPRPMLLSWPIDPVVATATTISPPKNDGPSDADHRESTAIPLLPRPAGTPRTGPVVPVTAAPEHRSDSPSAPSDAPVAKSKTGWNEAVREITADPQPSPVLALAPSLSTADERAPTDPAGHAPTHPAGSADLAQKQARKDEALRTLSPVSTLPEPRPELAPKSAHRSRSRAVVYIGAAFFLAGVAGSILLVRSLRHSPSDVALPAVTTNASPSLSPSGAPLTTADPAPIAPSPSSAAPSADPLAPSPSGAPLSPTASSTAVSSTSGAPTARPLGTGRVPRKTAPSSSKTSPPARPYGDPSRDL